MTEEQLNQFEEMVTKVNEMYRGFKDEQEGEILIDEDERIAQGIGFIGRTGNTTAGDSILVNSPEGPIEILIV